MSPAKKVFVPFDSVKRGKQVVTIECFGVDGPGSFDDARHGFDEARFRVFVRIFVIRRVGEASQRGDCIQDSMVSKKLLKYPFPVVRD